MIIWINHHYLMRFVRAPTLALTWINFVHLFMVSLLPFATSWIARRKLASSPVVFYAALFVCVDLAFNLFEREVFARAETTKLSERVRRVARRRSPVVLAIFTTAMVVAFVAPRLGFALICAAQGAPDPIRRRLSRVRMVRPTRPTFRRSCQPAR